MWKYTSYVRKGLSHENHGTDCQDKVVIYENPVCIVAALADGLGSLENSALAADAATQAVAEFFLSGKQTKKEISTPKSPVELSKKLIRTVQSRICEKAVELELSTDTMDCTLGFVCVHKQDGYAIIGRLGDSAVCIIKREGSIVINDPSISANGTSAVLDEGADQCLQIQICDLDAEEIRGFLLSSDGLDNEVYMKGSQYVLKAAEPYFNAVLHEDPQGIIREKVEELVSCEDSPFDDDISIAVISRAKNPLIFPEDPTWLCSCGTRNRIQDSYCSRCNNDIVTVYEKYRFRDHGGKYKFFLWMNHHPDKEEKIATNPITISDPNTGLGTGTRIDTNLDSETGAKKKKDDAINISVKESCGKGKRFSIIVVLVSFLIGILLGIPVGSIGRGIVQATLLREESSVIATEGAKTVETSENTEPVETTIATEMKSMEKEELEEGITHAEKSLHILQDGSVFWGSLDSGLPHGRGILLKDGYYYLGQFSAGKMDGTFSIISEDGDSHIPFVEFHENELYKPENDESWSCIILSSEVVIYDRVNGKQVDALEKGAVVYKTETTEVDSDGIVWAEVIWHNTVGWIHIDSSQ